MTDFPPRRSRKKKYNKVEDNPELAAEKEWGPRARPIAFVAVTLASLLIYLSTMAPAMHFGDGLEFAADAYVLGVPHPTGYPLFMLLLKAFSLFTFFIPEMIVRTTLFTALCGALGAGVSFLITERALRSVASTWTFKARLVSAAAVGLATALLRFHWSNAIVTEVYTLQFLLMVLFVLAAQIWFEKRQPRQLLYATLLFGLGLTHHRMTVFLGLPWLILWATALHGLGWNALKKPLLCGGAILLACLSLYAYLPIRAAMHPPINWGNPTTLSSFIQHVRGSEYLKMYLLRPAPGQEFTPETYALFTSLTIKQVFSDFVLQVSNLPMKILDVPGFGRAFATPGPGAAVMGFGMLVLAVWGAFEWMRSRPGEFMIAALVAAQNVVIFFLYNIRDISDYYLYLLWFLFLCSFLGLVRALSYMMLEVPAFRRLPAEISYLMLLLPAFVGMSNRHACDYRNDRSAETLSYMILPQSEEIMPRGSILLTGGDFDIYPSWYRQMVRGERRDVLVVGMNFMYEPWYKSFFTPEQISRYDIRFIPGIAHSPEEFTRKVIDGIIDKNVDKVPIFTSTPDPLVREELKKRYDVRKVLETMVQTGPGEEAAPIGLYRILPRTSKGA